MHLQGVSECNKKTGISKEERSVRMCVVKWLCYGLMIVYMAVIGVGVLFFYLIICLFKGEDRTDEDEENEEAT